MYMTTDTANPSPAETEPRRRPWLRWVIVAIVVLLVGGVTVGIVAAQDNDSPKATTTSGTQQLASIRRACTAWHNGYTGSNAPPSGWCDDMVGWMTNRVGSGQMMGSMMWSNPQQMREACEQWMSSNARDATNASAWCGDMVAWMTQNRGDWNQWNRGWMMNGSMMVR